MKLFGFPIFDYEDEGYSINAWKAQTSTCLSIKKKKEKKMVRDEERKIQILKMKLLKTKLNGITYKRCTQIVMVTITTIITAVMPTNNLQLENNIRIILWLESRSVNVNIKC